MSVVIEEQNSIERKVNISCKQRHKVKLLCCIMVAV